MSWATKYIEELQFGNTVQFRPRGHSMEGKISSGQLVTVEPLVFTTLDTNPTEVNICSGDIVLCEVNGQQYLHIVSHVIETMRSYEYQISNNKGHVNGWITIDSIFGKCVKIQN